MPSILITGVGGQGTLLASRVIGNAAIREGYDVKVSEVHGMSQRGGSVETFVRFSKGKVQSPIIDEGGADILLAFEILEACRSLGVLRRGGELIANTQEISPMPVISGQAKYPEGLVESLEAMDIKLRTVDALSLAIEAGSPKAVNVVLIGLLSKSLDFDLETWRLAISESAPARFLEANLKAFELARAAG
ncbi:MAG: indolepyruvate oxidoreductase subunit beta [Clostridiales bacterium]|nr:indolepyruvate oxidoreductase subunit beta [Clostridiales bacterium]MDR2751755.1 indolepyruvate oxidoreductase subunit beta [Clostridiales bacterium]